MEHDNVVSIRNGAQTVGYRNCCTVVTHAVQRCLDGPLRVRVERRRRFVQEDNLWRLQGGVSCRAVNGAVEKNG